MVGLAAHPSPLDSDPGANEVQHRVCPVVAVGFAAG